MKDDIEAAVGLLNELPPKLRELCRCGISFIVWDVTWRRAATMPNALRDYVAECMREFEAHAGKDRNEDI